MVGSTGVRGGESIPPETLVLLPPGRCTPLFPSACPPDPGILPFPDRDHKTQTAPRIDALTAQPEFQFRLGTLDTQEFGWIFERRHKGKWKNAERKKKLSPQNSIL